MRSNVDKVATYLEQAEPAYCTDTKQLFIGDATNRPALYPSLRDAICWNGEVVTLNEEIVWLV